MKDDEKASARAALIAPDGRLTLHLGGLEKICAENGGCSYAVGSTMTVADISIWRLVGWLSSGIIDGIPVDYVSSTFPHLAALVAGRRAPQGRRVEGAALEVLRAQVSDCVSNGLIL